MSLIHSDLPHITSIKYFTDAASKYKNFKAIINLAFYFHNHKLTAEHNFSATSHGESPGDGIGGTIMKDAYASVGDTIDNQLITTNKLYYWAKNSIKGVTSLESQYFSTSTMDGTRYYHCFIPKSNGCLIMKPILTDCHYDKHEFFNLDLQNDYS